MLDKSLPTLQSNHYWYFDKDTFNINGCSIIFQMSSITNTWRHVNSEGWEKYHDEIRLHLILQFANFEELFLLISEIYKFLASKDQWTSEILTSFLNKYDTHFSSEEIKDIMDDCY